MQNAGPCGVWNRAHVPVWDETIVGTWWRWAGRMGGLGAKDELRLCHVAATWRDSWWTNTERALLHTTACCCRRQQTQHDVD